MMTMRTKDDDRCTNDETAVLGLHEEKGLTPTNSTSLQYDDEIQL